MPSTFPRNLPYQILFALCVSVTYLNNYELTFAVWFCAILLCLKKSYSLGLFKYLAFFIGICLVAAVSSLFRNYEMFVIIRDITYMVKPILGILLGYQLCRNYDIKPFHTIIYTSLFIGIVHLGILLYSAVIYRIINIHELRFYGGYFGDFEFFALTFLLFHKEFGIDISPKRRRWLHIIIGLSAAMYVSRINFIQFFIIWLALKGYFRITRRAIIVMGTAITVLCSIYAVIYNMHVTRNGKGVEAFLYKIKNAPIEAFKTKIDEDDYEDFNDNYRSFENIITVKQVTREGWVTTIFGKGIGARVDVGRQMWTNDLEFIRYVPTLHNAFMTVFLKSGLIGVCLCVWFLIRLGKRNPTEDPLVIKLNLFFVGMAIFMVFAHWVLMGFYLKTDNKSILVGFLLCYREMAARNFRLKQKP